MKPIIVYSHGFGVRQDDRGLFSDISTAFPGYLHVQFDYNLVDNVQNTLTVAPLDVQARQLQTVLHTQQKLHPHSPISIICHSQGCVVAGLAQPMNIARIIFLAPPTQMLGPDKKTMFKLRPDTREDEAGTIWYPRRDGSTTIIKPAYWKSREGVKPIELYSELARCTQLVVIAAEQDEVLTDTTYSTLSKDIELLSLPANHDFSGSARKLLINQLRKLL